MMFKEKHLICRDPECITEFTPGDKNNFPNSTTAPMKLQFPECPLEAVSSSGSVPIDSHITMSNVRGEKTRSQPDTKTPLLSSVTAAVGLFLYDLKN